LPQFIVRLEADSVVRLGAKAYDEPASRRSLLLGLPYANVSVFDRFLQATEDLALPDGLIALVRLPAGDIDAAIGMARGMADHVLSMISCVSMASIEAPQPIWAYDATDGIEDREYRHFFYDLGVPRGSRPLDQANLFEFLRRNCDGFMARSDVKPDFKARVQRSILAFRRGMADNDDVLNEFLTAWSTMEGLDCVYCKLLPSARVREFKDSMKAVLSDLGNPDAFGRLERLRNDIAHGSLTLEQAIQVAEGHIELVRRALVLMILRILAVEFGVADTILAQQAHKGRFRPHLKILATIRFQPADIRDLGAQPRISASRTGAVYTKQPDSLGYAPDVRLEPVNVTSLTQREVQVWGDAGARVHVHGIDAKHESKLGEPPGPDS
jgi:hypothetical protein